MARVRGPFAALGWDGQGCLEWQHVEHLGTGAPFGSVHCACHVWMGPASALGPIPMPLCLPHERQQRSLAEHLC